MGRAEVVAIDGVRCAVRIFSGRTVGVSQLLAIKDVRLPMVDVGAEGRLVLRSGEAGDVHYLLLPD